MAVGKGVPFNKTAQTYRLEVNPPATCKKGAACQVDVRLVTLGEYHVNKEYPYKLKASASVPGVAFANRDGVFSRASGDFKEESENLGVTKVRFTAAESGSAKIQGTYKFSVCSKTDCKLESAELAFEAPIQ